MYDIQESPQAGVVSDGDQVSIEEVHEETWEEATERKDKENYDA